MHLAEDGRQLNNMMPLPSPDDVLECLVASGIIKEDDVGNVLEATRLMNLEKLIQKNLPYQIWQGKNGRWNCYVPDKSRTNGRRLLSSGSKEKLLDKLMGIAPEKYEAMYSSMTLRELYPIWKEYKSLMVEESTMPRMETDWRKHYENDPIIDIPITQLNKVYLETWLVTMIKKYSMTKTNYYNVSSIIRQMFEYAYEIGIIQDNPMLRVKKNLKKLFKKVDKPEDETQVYTAEEVVMIRNLILEIIKSPGRRIYELAPLAILFQFYTGMRIGEICALEYSDISLDGKVDVSKMLVRDFGTVRDSTKGSTGHRTIHLAPTALEIVNLTIDYKGGDTSGYIFSTNKEPLKERTINDYLARYCKKLGIPYRSSHKLRKTALSTMVKEGMSPNAVSKYAGNTMPTLLNYYVFDVEGQKTRNMQIDQALSYQ